MQAQFKPPYYARYNTFHGPKRQLLGQQANFVPPAWRTSPLNAVQPGPIGKARVVPLDNGSKIFLSRLPVDVGEKEVEELFKKTIGPLKESFLIYNSQGMSKGMAVVTFQRTADAVAAREKYNGKIVDGRRPIKIEIITDGASTSSLPKLPPQVPTLLNRLGGIARPNVSQPPTPLNPSVPVAPRVQPRPATSKPNHLLVPAPMHAALAAPIAPRRFRMKKGPKRLKKREVVTQDQLDKEMEDYRASAPEPL